MVKPSIGRNYSFPKKEARFFGIIGKDKEDRNHDFWYSYLECLEWSLRTHDIIEAQINHKTNQRKVKVAYKKRNSLRVPLLIYIFNNFIEQRNYF